MDGQRILRSGLRAGPRLQGRRNAAGSPLQIHRGPDLFHDGHSCSPAAISRGPEFQKRPVAIISENFAREYWGRAANAIGKRSAWALATGGARSSAWPRTSTMTVSDKPRQRRLLAALSRTTSSKKEMIRRREFCACSPRAGRAAFVQRDSAGCLVRRSPDLPLADQTRRCALYQVHGPHVVHACDAVCGRACPCCSASSDLWSHRLCGVAAHARDRHPYGAGRTARSELTRHVCPPGLVLTASALPAGSWWRSSCGDAPDVLVAVQCQPDRPITYAITVSCMVATA